MPLQVITKNREAFSIRSSTDFERIFSVQHAAGLQFKDGQTQSLILKRTQMAVFKKWITARQKWLGHYYAQGIEGKIPLDLTIKWINDILGYGLWTNCDIAPKTFIGEYAGLLRKRRLRKRWHNLYCFDYTIGEKRSSSYVIDAQDQGNHTRFINHSFKPNLAFVSVYYQTAIRVIVYAKRWICAGEQLCYDYGEEFWEKRSEPIDL